MKVPLDVDEISFRNADIYEQYEENVLAIDLYYPKQNQFDTIQLDVVSVRGTDDIRIKYDYVRGGWSISKRDFNEVNGVEIELWKEVSFIYD